MRRRESKEAAALRWEHLRTLQGAYPTFVPFLRDMMAELGFSTTKIQDEIGEFLEGGPDRLMIQAQRGQAKTTIVAIFAVWSLIHNPKARVLVVSAGSEQASEISTLIVNLIQTVDILECLQPDRTAGDRTSVEHFDVHHSLKGVDKSPSVACVGSTANLQGKRADILIADDVESYKNSLTATMREHLMQITRDFISIATDGRIIYLGTPQSTDSIYNTLPGRGFAVRIWPGRYPSAAQIAHYGDMLAPSIAAAIAADPQLQAGGGLDGQQGRAIDLRITESMLQAKELDQGTPYFQLQHMLLTALTDAMRFPIKPERLVAMRVDSERMPMVVNRSHMAVHDVTVQTKKYKLAAVGSVSEDTGAFQNTGMYIDPAGGGQNGDETGWAFGSLLNSSIYLRGYGGLPGGYARDTLEALAQIIISRRPTWVAIEKNYGHGAFREVFAPILAEAVREYNAKTTAPYNPPALLDDLVTGQKELRIIDTLEPIIGRGSLIVDIDALSAEGAGLAKYDPKVRDTYSLLFQLSRITRDRGSLAHDDRADALTGLVRQFLPALAQVEADVIRKAREAEALAWLRNPTGLPQRLLQTPRPSSGVSARIKRF